MDTVTAQAAALPLLPSSSKRENGLSHLKGRAAGRGAAGLCMNVEGTFICSAAAPSPSLLLEQEFSLGQTMAAAALLLGAWVRFALGKMLWARAERTTEPWAESQHVLALSAEKWGEGKYLQKMPEQLGSAGKCLSCQDPRSLFPLGWMCRWDSIVLEEEVDNFKCLNSALN